MISGFGYTGNTCSEDQFFVGFGVFDSNMDYHQT